MKKPALLLAFDFDGVIADSLEHNLQVMNKAARAVALPDLFTRANVAACEVMSWQYVSEKCGVPIEMQSQYAEHLFEILETDPPPAHLFPEMGELLREAPQLGRVVVATSNFESLTRQVLKNHGLLDCVERIYGAETSSDKSEKLKLAMDYCGVAPAQTIKIGDCVSDIKHARNVGAHVIAVSWGFNTRQLLDDAQPDALADSPAELLGWLKKWSA